MIYSLELSHSLKQQTLHMLENAKVDFEISEQDMEILKSIKPLKDYGEYSSFPVFSGK